MRRIMRCRLECNDTLYNILNILDRIPIGFIRLLKRIAVRYNAFHIDLATRYGCDGRRIQILMLVAYLNFRWDIRKYRFPLSTQKL